MNLLFTPSPTNKEQDVVVDLVDSQRDHAEEYKNMVSDNISNESEYCCFQRQRITFLNANFSRWSCKIMVKQMPSFKIVLLLHKQTEPGIKRATSFIVMNRDCYDNTTRYELLISLFGRRPRTAAMIFDKNFLIFKDNPYSTTRQYFKQTRSTTRKLHDTR